MQLSTSSPGTLPTEVPSSSASLCSCRSVSAFFYLCVSFFVHLFVCLFICICFIVHLCVFVFLCFGVLCFLHACVSGYLRVLRSHRHHSIPTNSSLHIFSCSCFTPRWKTPSEWWQECCVSWLQRRTRWRRLNKREPLPHSPNSSTLITPPLVCFLLCFCLFQCLVLYPFLLFMFVRVYF